MQGRTALIAAIACGAVAVAIVALDLNFGLEAELQALDDGEWVSTSDGSLYREPGFGCVGRDLRLHVDNNRFVAAEVDVHVSYYDLQGNTVTVLDDTWELAAGESRDHAFRIPDSAFVPRETDNDTGPKPFGGYTVSVNAYAGDIPMYACVQEVQQ